MRQRVTRRAHKAASLHIFNISNGQVAGLDGIFSLKRLEGEIILALGSNPS